jgi:hypothetical protein
MRDIYEQLVNLELRVGYKDPEYNIAAFQALYWKYQDKNMQEW